MRQFNFPLKNKKTILSLGAESAGNFSVFHKNKIYFSEDFGDLLDEKNFRKFQKAVLNFLRKNKIKPKVILTDLHPEIKTTLWGKELARKFSSEYVQIQHHHAHLFSQFSNFSALPAGEQFPISQKIPRTERKVPDIVYGIALDGTGYGTDGKIWGGECFMITKSQIPISKQISNLKFKISKEYQIRNAKYEIQKIGHLENQIMLGGDLAIKEPARMLIAILTKINNCESKIKTNNKSANTTVLYNTIANVKKDITKNNKDFVYNFVKKYYFKNQFELLWSQLQQNFNCQETSSTGRILDAVSVLLGFAGNKRKYKHEATYLLEKNSAKPYTDLRPKIIKNYELSTTYLFEYLIKNINKDKHRLATTAQLYIAQGLRQIIFNFQSADQRTISNNKIFKKIAFNKNEMPNIILSGGIGDNKIISEYFNSKSVVINLNKNKIPRGDAGLSFGQIGYYLSARKK